MSAEDEGGGDLLDSDVGAGGCGGLEGAVGLAVGLDVAVDLGLDVAVPAVPVAFAHGGVLLFDGLGHGVGCPVWFMGDGSGRQSGASTASSYKVNVREE